MPMKPNRRTVSLEDRRRTEQVEEGLGLGQPVEDDRRDAERDQRHVSARPARLEEAAPERPSIDPPLLVDQPPTARAGPTGGTRP